MSIVYHPLFRQSVILVAIIVLMIFCIDKSRQNRRTRNALYNCIYPLFVGAVVQSEQMVNHFMEYCILNNLLGLAIVVVGSIIYWRFLKPQKDIPFNQVFYYLGWMVLGFLVVFLGLMLFFSIRDNHPFYA